MITLDLSNHDESTLDAPCMYAAGVRRVIMGCQMGGAPARRMIPKLRGSSIEVRDDYAFLGFNGWYLQPTNDAIRVAHELEIPRVFLDAEGDDVMTGHIVPGVTPRMRIDRLGECVTLVENAGLKAGIYTGGWFWPPYMDNTTAFSHLPLWHSAYPQDGHEIHEVAYGGWEKVAIHQYTSSLVICGRVRDANHVFEEEEAMTAAEREEFENLILSNWGAAGEERLPREERLVNARYRMGNAVNATEGGMPLSGRIEEHIAVTEGR